ncbi:MAG: hypothetical protein AAFU69_07610 [Pseudomonadota bacterium]
MLVDHKQFETLNGPILNRDAMTGHTAILVWTLIGSVGLVLATYLVRLVS